ncbi:(Fe-S)-binding protein [Halovenus amylolytica]|uniref:(Fe-S)-binding protein n=1 Tax=Halovenus amylolytica TaxID=2500550 RepID=UPI003D6BC4F5
MDIRANMIAGRTDVVEHGYAPPAVEDVRHRSQREHNAYGEPHNQRFANIDSTVLNRFQDRTAPSVGLWIGCTTAYYEPEIFESLAAILDASDVAAGIVEEERCCGLPQYKLGLRDTALDLMEHNANAINNRGFETLVVDCPECYRALNDYYPHFGHDISPEIVHSSQFIQTLLEEGTLELNSTVSETVSYHDPYELSRHTAPIDRNEYDTSDIHEPPREVLDSIPGLHREELRHNRNKAFSCGGDIGVRKMHPDVAQKVGQTVLDEVVTAGADTVAVASPECKRHLSETITENDLNLEVASIPELVARTL